MSSSRKDSEHAGRVVPIARLAENLLIDDYDRVRAENECVRLLVEDSQSLFAGESFGGNSGTLAVSEDFWDIRRLHREGYPCVAQQFLAPRRSGGENEIHRSDFIGKLLLSS